MQSDRCPMRTERGWCWLQELAGKASQTLKERVLNSTVSTCFLSYLQGPPRMLCSLGPPLLISAHLVLVDMELIDCHPLATVRDKAMSDFSRPPLPLNHSV